MFNETKIFLAFLACMLSHVKLFCNPMDCIARQAPLSMEFSRQEYWSGMTFSSPGDLCDPEIKPVSSTSLLHWHVDSLPLCHRKPFTKSSRSHAKLSCTVF